MASAGRVLFIHFRQLGDVLLTSALLDDLREHNPQWTIDFLTSPVGAELLRGNPAVASVVGEDRSRLLGVARRVRAGRYDMVFDFQTSGTTAFITRFSGAPRRVGWDKRWRGAAYTERVPVVHRDEYVVRHRQRLLEFAGIPVRPRVPRIYLSTAEREEAARAVSALPMRPGVPRVALVLGARAVGSMWPVERFADLAAAVAETGAAPVAIVTPDSEARVAALCAAVPRTLRAEFSSLRSFAAALSTFDIVVSGDSGPAHIAMAVGTPTVTLYGSSRAEQWNPGLATTVAVSSPRARCTACARGRPRLDDRHTCMAEIDAPTVVARVKALLAAKHALRPG